MIEIFFYFFFYILIIFSVVGYGFIGSKIINIKLSLGEIGFIGLLTLILISYSTNFIFSHSSVHNSIIIIIGLIFSFFYFFQNKKLKKKEFFNCFGIFFILFFGLLMFKNHDDFFYYHLSYTISLVEHRKIFGIGNLNHGFRTPSSLFYLNSLFYLPYIKLKLLNLGAILFLGFSNIFFLEKIYTKLKSKKLNLTFFLILLSFIFINTSFYRIAEHGTDKSALILIFVLIVIYLDSISLDIKSQKRNLEFNYTLLIILILLIVSLKSFYLIYFIILLLWIYQNYKVFKFIEIKNLIFKSPISYIGFYAIFLFIFTVFSNTGCLVYPASFSCFNQFSWSIPSEQVIQMKNWYMLWSKGGATPNYSVDDPKFYLSNFNWVKNWINIYFFTKITDLLLVIFTILLVTFFVFKKNITKKINYNIYKPIYFLIIILTVEWFINHPALRYGGYTIIVLIYFIPLSIYLFQNYTFEKNTKKKVFYLISITIFIFMAKNIDRIYKEKNKYDFDIFKNPYFFVKEDAYILNKKISRLDKLSKIKKDNFYLIINKELLNYDN